MDIELRRPRDDCMLIKDRARTPEGVRDGRVGFMGTGEVRERRDELVGL